MHNSHDNPSSASRFSATNRGLTINLPDEPSTSAFAARLASAIQPGLIIYLHGDLGAGKTTLVRALLTELGYKGRVKSPTYTLLEQYDVAGKQFLHFDLYRFRDATEWDEAGFNDEFNDQNICLLEWPEKAEGLLPPADLEIHFEILPDGRNITIYAQSGTGTACLNSLQKQV